MSFTTALFEGLAPDGGLYVPEAIEPWTADELRRLPRRTLTEIGLLGLVAMRVGKKLQWNASAMKCGNAPEADQFLKESYRAGWEIPA